MTILRKEKEGKTITENQFNELLLQCSWEVANSEYDRYESTQRETDAIKSLKYSENVSIDPFGESELSNLTYTYWHPSYCRYAYNSNNYEIDVVTDSEWNDRLSGSLKQPNEYYPVVKVIGDKLKFYPLAQEYSSTNLVSNSGYSGTNDWVDSDADDIADGWSLTYSLITATILDSTGEYGFEGRAQGGYFNQAQVPFQYTSSVFRRNKWFYYEFEYYLDDGTETVTLSLWANAVEKVEDIDVTLGKRVKVSGIFYNSFETVLDSTMVIFFLSTGVEADRLVYIDKVFFSELGSDLEATFGYLKEPDDPYFDYYYDANDEIVYLTPNTSYTLQTGETYIDKDDGTERTSGYEITASENKSVELFLPEGERYKVLYCILQKMGVSLNEQDALQYGLIKEQKEES